MSVTVHSWKGDAMNRARSAGPFIPPVKRPEDKIDCLDLSMVKMKLCLPVDQDGKGWTMEYAEKAEEQYKMYLKLSVRFPEANLVPTALIDEMWHQHILDTQTYADDCQRIFGRMLHHFPYFGLRGGEDAANLQRSFASTVALFEEHFGIDITQGDEAHDCTGHGCGRIADDPWIEHDGPKPERMSYCSGPCGPSGCSSR